MSNLTNISKLSNNELTMSSRDLLDVINEVRKSEGENSIRSNDFHLRVADELSDFNYETFVVQNLNNQELNELIKFGFTQKGFELFKKAFLKAKGGQS